MNRNKKGSAAPKAAKQVKGKPKNKSYNEKSSSQVAVAASYAGERIESGKPLIQQFSNGNVRIRHKELLGSLTGSVGFAVPFIIPVNPGMPTFAPWLSVEAQGFEKHEFHDVVLESVTRTGTNVPGSIQLVPDYDAADAAPVSELVASTYEGCIEDVVWKTIRLRLDKSRLRGERYIRSGGLAANQDIVNRDPAQLFVTTTDGTAVNWSKIWIYYDVTLINPQLQAGGAYGSGTLASAGGSISAAVPFGAAPISTGSFSIAPGGAITMNNLSIGTEYSFSISSVGTVITIYTLSSTSGNTFVTNRVAISSAATTAYGFITFTATAATAVITIAVTATTVTATDLVVCALTPAPSF